MKHHGGNRRRKALRERKAWRPNEVDQLRYDPRKNQRADQWGRYGDQERDDERRP